MPLNKFFCTPCKTEKLTFKTKVECSICKKSMKKAIPSPSTKFQAPTCPVMKEKGYSTIKNIDAILDERSQEDTRKNFHHSIRQDTFVEAVSKKWINEKGEKRKKIEDK